MEKSNSKELEIEGKKIKIQIWDATGEKAFLPIIRPYFKISTCIVLVYDLTKKSSFASCVKWLNEIKFNSSKVLPTILIGNKKDLEDKRVIDKKEGENFALKNGLLFLETSAKTGENIEYLFNLTAKKIINQEVFGPEIPSSYSENDNNFEDNDNEKKEEENNIISSSTEKITDEKDEEKIIEEKKIEKESFENFVFNPNDVENKEYFQNVKSVVLCNYCHSIVNQPFECLECQNVFCKNCALKLNEKDKGCPFKCKNFELRESKLLKNILSALKFNCKNKCGKIISYDDLKDHYDEEEGKLNIYKEKCEKLENEIKDLKNKYELLYKFNQVTSHLSENWRFHTKKHIHPLMYVQTFREQYTCENCKKIFPKNSLTYYCTLCDFDLCEKCKKEEENK